MGYSETMITPTAANEEGWTIVDVRSTGEHAVACISGALHIPLERLVESHTDLHGRRIALLCKGGTRARMAQERLAACGVDAVVIDGGLDRWQREGLPLVRGTAGTWSLERQVRLGAGLLVLASMLLAVFVSTKWLWLTGFVGCGLTFAGLTDICMMGSLLARMPWNRIRSAP